MKTVIAALVLAVAFAAGAQPPTAPVVAVTGGQVRGAMLGTGAVFKGVPFARPPTGDLRWREPLPVQPWSGIRDAAAFGPLCAQKPTPIVPDAAQSSKEDCLYLNIWTPRWPAAASMPVMVWIPGGGNFAGGSSGPWTEGERLAGHGVVVVSLNYRLGSLGFFSHPALTRESPNRASGNQGILDQIAALRWVRDNIERFGGDPANVTIFGESAGSLDVSVLMTSPLSQGLFRRAVGQSGAVILVGEPLTLAQAEQRGAEQLERAGPPRGATAADLRTLAASAIFAAEPDYLRTPPPNLGITIDGYVFPRKPADVFAAGEAHRVDLMLGSNAHEIVPGSALPGDVGAAIDAAYGSRASRGRALYTDTDPLYRSPAQQWATDTSFRCSAVAQLLWHAAAGNVAYHYELARIAPGREALGVPHAADIAYVFGTVDAGIIGAGGPPAQANDVDRRVSAQMQSYWTNFAKAGDPNGAGLSTWPRFDPAARAYVQFTDSGAVAKEGLRRRQCDLWLESQ
jgi:para-nitrobenzyl esterase